MVRRAAMFTLLVEGVGFVILFVRFVAGGTSAGIALWRAGRNGHLGWFIALFLLNTLGILPIIYIFAFSRRGERIPAYESGEIINE